MNEKQYSLQFQYIFILALESNSSRPKLVFLYFFNPGTKFPGVLKISYVNLRIERLLLRDIFTSQKGTMESNGIPALLGNWDTLE